MAQIGGGIRVTTQSMYLDSLRGNRLVGAGLVLGLLGGQFLQTNWLTSDTGALWNQPRPLERPLRRAARRFLAKHGQEVGEVVSYSGKRRALDLITESLVERLTLYLLKGSGCSFAGAMLEEGQEIGSWVVDSVDYGGSNADCARVCLRSSVSPLFRIATVQTQGVTQEVRVQATDIYPKSAQPSFPELLLHRIQLRRHLSATKAMRVDNEASQLMILRMLAKLKEKMGYRDHLVGNALLEEKNR
eukprot:TRINITY_DN4081_c1_g1_i1.p1 TRINITY_DN4081_c1_g1~~TRINITY_DN4081_c1_g1_i1.p1  ORF type:complete len:263 (+),score=83.46 TRINITY_DN4081_c1_g1_i1:55-789(+)